MKTLLCFSAIALFNIFVPESSVCPKSQHINSEFFAPERRLSSIVLKVEKEGEVANYNITADTQSEYYKAFDDILKTYSDFAGQIQITVEVNINVENSINETAELQSLKLSRSVTCKGAEGFEFGKKIREELIAKARV